MRAAPMLVVAACLATGLPRPAYGGVDIVPDPVRPGLILDGTEIIRPKPIATPIDVGGAPALPPPLPTDTLNTHCELDDAGVQQCYYVGNDGEPVEPDEQPELTPGDVLRATREIGLPSLRIQIQPGDKTLVNIPTIFYTQPQPFTRSITLLGFDVDLTAEPTSYQWIHGDGTTTTTTTPGKPYPAKDITHRYRQPAHNIQPRVDVTYQVTYRVDNGPWQTLQQTLLASGPTTQLDVNEAAPVMTTPRE